MIEQHAADDVQALDRSRRDRSALSVGDDGTTGTRLRTAEERDQAALRRDRGAEGRDALARLHDLDDDENASLEEVLARSRRDRARAAADRAKAAYDRAHAAADREAAARARAEALRHRAEWADALRSATTDELTGAWTRWFGLEEAARELERAHRTGSSLVLVFVDVDRLKHVNDSRGHMAGDALLRLVGETIRSNLRPYDVILRYGGDEFICVTPNLSAAETRARFERIATALSRADVKHSISFGLAIAAPDDDLEVLIARADANLLRARRSAGPSASSGRKSRHRFPSTAHPTRGGSTMTTEAEGPKVDPAAEAEGQARPTTSVGQPLSPKDQDAGVPLYKRWLKRIPHA